MIKDSEFARKEMINKPDPGFKLRFVPNEDPLLSVEDREKFPVPQLTQKNPAVFSSNEPTGILHGLYLVGKVPRNHYEQTQMKRDWAVIRSSVNPKEDYLDELPPINVPIVAMLEGRKTIAEGMVVDHVMTNDDGTTKTELVFMELIRKPEGSELLSASGMVKYGNDGEIRRALFIPQQFEAIVGWTYLSEDGAINRHHGVLNRTVTELFLDCEFDDATRSLISVGITTAMGRVYYAFDSKAADQTKNEWVVEHVNSVLFDVPPGTMFTDLNAKNVTWSEWLKAVIEAETGLHRNVIIHTDFPTDVGYIAPLLHLGEGRRIGHMPNFQFHINYVDPYPTTIKDAIQHNAAWDSVALWHHLGYYSYKVIHDLSQAGMLQKKVPFGSRASMPDELAEALTRHQVWFGKAAPTPTDQMVGLVKGPDENADKATILHIPKERK